MTPTEKYVARVKQLDAEYMAAKAAAQGDKQKLYLAFSRWEHAKKNANDSLIFTLDDLYKIGDPK